MLSAIVIAKNEASTIKVCLESLSWVDELIVINNGSTDKTAEISKEYTDKVFSFESDDFAKTRNFGMEKAKGEWVLYVDADERVLKSLKEEIKQLIETTNASAYALSRRNIIFGQEVSYGPYKNDWVIRLLKRSDFQEWVGKVHEYPKFSGELGYTKNSLLHLTHRNLDHFLQKSLEWSHIDAQLRIKAHHPKMTHWRFLRILITELINQGIKRKGFFAGTIGVIDSLLQVVSFFISYVRLWEYQQRPTIAEKYTAIDEELIKKDFDY